MTTDLRGKPVFVTFNETHESFVAASNALREMLATFGKTHQFFIQRTVANEKPVFAVVTNRRK